MSIRAILVDSIRLISLGLLTLCFLSCESTGPNPSAPSTAPGPEAETTLSFTDVTDQVQWDFISSGGGEDKKHLLESTGSGVGIADIDGDGWEDVYLVTQQPTEAWLRGERPLSNRLLRNLGNGTFEDITEQAGVGASVWSSGVYFADVDNDGDSDLFLTTWGENLFYRNQGDGTFKNETTLAGLGGGNQDWSAGAYFSDLDADGDLDLYVTNYAEYDLANPPFGGEFTDYKGLQVFRGPVGFTAQADRLYENDGTGRFKEISAASGIHDRAPLYGLGVVIFDADGDSDPDIYVANDSTDNFLFRNDGNLKFQEIGTLTGVATNEDAKQQAGMGTDFGDLNGDGLFDIVVTNFSHDWNTVYRNLGNSIFRDATFESGFQDSFLPLAWGVNIFDANSDGALDIFIANGHIYPWIDHSPQLGTSYHQRNLMYQNLGDGLFVDVAQNAGPGMQLVEGTRGSAVADLDLDGDLDLVISNLDGPCRWLRNDSPQGQFVQIWFRGVDSPKDSIGAKITATAGDKVWVRQVNPYGSYLSTGTRMIHLGTGDANSIEKLQVEWPSGQVDVHENLATGQRYQLVEGEPWSVWTAPAMSQ